MKPSPSRLAAAAALLLLLAATPPTHALDESELPETLRSGYVGPVVGPANDEAYARGALGLLRPGYGRASLYVAYRLMQLPPGAVAAESHQRVGDAFLGQVNKPYSRGPDEIDDWLRARAAIVPTPPAARPDYFRTRRRRIAGANGLPEFEVTETEGNCGAGAFAFATRTLAGLAADASFGDADRRAWVAGQDAVFARCAWIPGSGPAPALPEELPARASPRLKALRAYQHAAALFYAGDFEHARAEFDAIAATPDHPQRAWAALGALRSVVRPATGDPAWQAAFDDAYTRRGLRGAELSAALAPAAAAHRALAEAALAEVGRRYAAIAGEPALAEVKAPAQYTARRALSQLQPARVVAWAMEGLDHTEANPYRGGLLDLWTTYYVRVLPDRPDGPTLELLRKHPFFDWIVSVQGCGEATHAPDEAVCAAEHAHARARWQETRRNDWLLAALMTARRPDAADLAAAEAAPAVARERPEWASLQFYAARVLRAQGRAADARRLLDALSGAPEIDPRDRPLVAAQRRALAD
jgi:hypothetical protein